MERENVSRRPSMCRALLPRRARATCTTVSYGAACALRLCLSVIAASLLLASERSGSAATTQRRYYAHDAVEDSHGVIAPWYQGQNGQIDLRVRIAAEFLKRYPWGTSPCSAWSFWSGCPRPSVQYIV